MLEPASAPAVQPSALKLPAFFVELFNSAALHTSPDRHALLYRLAWRLLREPGLRHDTLDADRVQAELLARAVRRDVHKMHAFVRFRPLAAARSDAGTETDTDGIGHDIAHIAWFEPAHHIIEAAAPFFARRFAQMKWAILTPEKSVQWDGLKLVFGPGARRDQAPPADADEALWLTYYQSIFNPARLKLAMMQKEMPRRYWHNLPEATLIQPLVALSAQRSGRMVEQEVIEPQRRRPAASLGLRYESPDAFAPMGSATSARMPAAGEGAPLLGLADLRQATERCRACPIGRHATQAVHGEGPIGARLMLVGEQPGDQEDLRGRPFVGPAGQLLDRALAAVGLPRDLLYLTNAVKHFKFTLRGTRRIHKTPAQQEAAACLDWLEHEIGLVQPQALVALGATAARSMLGREVRVTQERGQWLQRGDGLPVLVTLHPSALLRMPPQDFETAYSGWLADLRLAATWADATQSPSPTPAEPLAGNSVETSAEASAVTPL